MNSSPSPDHFQAWIDQIGERTPVLIVGAGALGVIALDAIRAGAIADPWCAFVDDSPQRIGEMVHGTPVFGPIDRVLGTQTAAHLPAVAAIADNAVRADLVSRHQATTWLTVIHPAATVSPLAQIGTGSIVLAGTVIDPEAWIGQHVVINKCCSIGHNCTIETCAQLAPGVASGGAIGEQAFIGMGASVLPGVQIGASATVGAGAVVTSNVSPGVTAVGVPAAALS